ncbi:hypothetical protein AB0K74_11340 [Streptomyces sp. NPDC056159]|uniref:hypothetical protein n=1 Tax=Streptomyces sp. NPDC056159 TaxID=3155537 RepID=UPI0034487B07
MHPRLAAACLVAVVLLTACATHADDGSADARRVCISIGAGEGSTPRPDSTPADVDWAMLADGLNTRADAAASAARKDARWDRLADSLNTLQRLTAGLAAQQADGMARPELAPEDRRQAVEAYDVMNSECRKARAD